jgi:hypothetical protein
MNPSRPILIAVLAAWLLIALVAGHAGMFEAGAGQPPLGILIAIVVPLILFALLYWSSTPFRRFALGIDLRWLTVMQSWRVIGVMFLALYAFGLLPGSSRGRPVSATPSSVVGTLRLEAIVRGEPTWRRRVIWLNVGGLVDFAVALGTGVLTSPSSIGWFADAAPGASLGALPLSLVPTFAVPLWTIFHVISLVQLRRAESRQQNFTICTHALDTARASS